MISVVFVFVANQRRMHSTSEPFTGSAIHELRPVGLVSHIVALLGWVLDELLTHNLNAHRGPRREAQACELPAKR